jgi:hypothetical protein
VKYIFQFSHLLATLFLSALERSVFMSSKNRVRGRDLAKEALWRERMSSQVESGLSVRAYCRAEGVGEARFHWWRRALKLRDAESAGTPEASRVNGASSDAPGQSAFVEVTPSVAKGDGLPVATDASVPLVEVVLGAGRVLRVRDGFAPETVSRLVALLEEGSC